MQAHRKQIEKQFMFHNNSFYHINIIVTIMATIKYVGNLSILRSIRNELSKFMKNGKKSEGFTRDPSIDHMLRLFRGNQVTEKRFCRSEDHYKYFAETYLTYLKSTRLQDELVRKYYHKGDKSVKDSARLVGLELPKQVQ